MDLIEISLLLIPFHVIRKTFSLSVRYLIYQTYSTYPLSQSSSSTPNVVCVISIIDKEIYMIGTERQNPHTLLHVPRVLSDKMNLVVINFRYDSRKKLFFYYRVFSVY